MYTPYQLKLAGYRLVIVNMNGKTFLCHAPTLPDGRLVIPLDWIKEKLGIPENACIQLH